MDVPIPEPATPSLQCYNNLTLCNTAEDSGYHTSFTPGSIDLTGICSETPSLLSPKIVITGHIQVAKTSNINFHQDNRSNLSTLCTSVNECLDEQTPQRRGVKRSYDNDGDFLNTSHNHNSSTATPTSIIAGEIQQKLVFDDNKRNVLKASKKLHTSEPFSSYELVPVQSYPTTPVKKNCKSSCKLSPFNRKKFSRKAEFVTHSLSCERKALQPVKRRLKIGGEQLGQKFIKFRPNQDIIMQLYEKGQTVPLKIILNYLSNEDIYNFTLVSDSWRYTWENTIGEKSKQKQEYEKYLDAVSTNVENWENGVVPKLPGSAQSRTLKEIHNELQHQPPTSPPGTPRTNRFKKFTRAASIDIRAQISCMQCQYPAKVTKEISGEVWAECTNSTCAHQFCKSCRGKRHPGTSCLQYDLNEPSPSKRKKNFYPVNSKKSKKNLCRLLC